MKNKKRNQIVIFALLILLNLIIRFPLIPHEVGLDSFYIHSISDVITTFGEVKFISHPLQFLGFSSQPPSVPILISGLAQTTGLSSEHSILVLSLIITILGIFTYYTLIYSITKNEFQSFFATLIFSTAPEFLRITLWMATTRALFMALFPLFFYLLFKTVNKNRRLTSALLSILLFAILLSTHHLGILILLVLITFLVTFILSTNSVALTINSKKLPDSIIWSFIYIIAISLVIFKVGFIKDQPNLWIIYTVGKFFTGDSPQILFFNMIIDYATKISILMFLAPIGIFALFYFRNKRNMFENFSLITLLFTAPIIAVGVYTPMFLLIILSFLVSVGIMTLLEVNTIKKVAKILVPSLIVISLCFSYFMLFNWGYKSIESDPDRYMPETKNTAMFLKEYGGEGSFTSNERGGNMFKYSSYSGMQGVPGSMYNDVKLKPRINIDPKELMTGGIESLIVFEKENITENNTSYTWDKYPESKNATGNNTNDNITENKTLDIWYEFPQLWAGSLEEGRHIIDKYNIKYVLETQFGGYSVTYVKNMKLFNDVHASKPKVYDNSKEEIYFIQ